MYIDIQLESVIIEWNGRVEYEYYCFWNGGKKNNVKEKKVQPRAENRKLRKTFEYKFNKEKVVHDKIVAVKIFGSEDSKSETLDTPF